MTDIIQESGIVTHWEIPKDNLKRFLIEIRSNYQGNDTEFDNYLKRLKNRRLNPLTPFDYLKAKKFSGAKTAQK